MMACGHHVHMVFRDDGNRENDIFNCLVVIEL